MADGVNALAWRLARRELRGGLKGFRVFVTCLALGVAAIAAVGWLGSAVVGGLKADARKLLGGDVEIRLMHRPTDEAQRSYLATNTARLSESVEMRAMAHAAASGGERTLVQLKAVDGAYPLVGGVTTVPASPLANLLGRDGGMFGAVVDPKLLAKLKITVGEPTRVGKATFRVAGTITAEPDRVTSIVNFGPRLLISTAALAETGLVQPGSLIQYYTKMMLPAGADFASWRGQLDTRFPDAGWRVRAPDEAAPGVKRFIERLTLFMSFVGYTVLLVGAVGISRAVSGYLQGKVRTIATFKCLGSPAGLIVRVYLMQILVLAAVGIAIGIAAGIALPWVALSFLKGLLPVEPVIALYPVALVQAAAFGVLASVTAALLPLGRAREVPARDLFRAAAGALGNRPRPRFLLAVAVGIAGLVGLVFLSSTDKWFALWFVVGAAATVGALALAGALLLRFSRWPRPGNAVLRLVLANLNRPGTSAPGVVLSLGLGLSVLVAVVQIEGNVGRQIAERLPEKAPAYFFIDIQPDQVEAFERVVRSIPGVSDLQREPTVRGRIVAIAGKPVEEVAVAPEAQWAIRGDRSLTAAASPKADASIVAGDWWPADYRGKPLISLDANLAKGFGIGVGDELTVSILGRDITATVANTREIDWSSLRFDFAIVFSPGVLEGAPHSHIAAARATPDAEAKLERAVTDAFDNVSAIHVRDALAAAAELLDGISKAVSAVAAVTVAAGAVVLAGALAAGQQRRIFDAVVFKVLGATRRRIAGTFALEYGLLGLITAAAAVGVGSLSAWGVVKFLMRMDWTWLPWHAATTVAVALAATLVFGLAGSWRILGLKAAPYLRND